MSKLKIFCYIIIVFLLSCKSSTIKNKLVVDAGSFLDSSQTKEIDGKLRAIDKKGVYHLFVYTVIAEKYYKHKNYDEYIFGVVSGKVTTTNNNILLYFSYDDKKIKIDTGNKAREVITDSLSQLAINRLIPYFSQRQYYDGIEATISYIDSLFMKKPNNVK